MWMRCSTPGVLDHLSDHQTLRFLNDLKFWGHRSCLTSSEYGTNSLYATLGTLMSTRPFFAFVVAGNNVCLSHHPMFNVYHLKAARYPNWMSKPQPFALKISGFKYVLLENHYEHSSTEYKKMNTFVDYKNSHFLSYFI